MTITHIDIDVARQRLTVYDRKCAVIFERSVSTARRGLGERKGSECTPRGIHVIRAKIGAGCPPNTVFVRRRPTGESYTPSLARRHPERDWILTRILWLSGTQLGFNRLGAVDTMQRYVYIHGAPDEDVLGQPSSHGCIKMHNTDVVALFDMVQVGTPVEIRG